MNRNEGLQSKLRSKMNRLVRRTKGYTKRVEMLEHLLAIALEECLNQSIKSNTLHTENTQPPTSVRPRPQFAIIPKRR